MIERAAQLLELVTSLAVLRDEDGVLSITVGLEPGARAGRRPGAQIELENELSRLRDVPGFTRVHERRLAELASRIEDLLDPAASGRGRALYVAIGANETAEASLQAPLPTAARLAPVARVLPLVGALEAGRPAGLVGISREAADVQEAELGVVRPVARIDLEPLVGDWWPEMKGAAAANPLRGQEVVSHRDRYDRRVEAAYRRGLQEAATTVAALARERGWTRAALAGDARLTLPLDEALAEHGLTTAILKANLEGLRPAQARDRLLAVLSSLVERQTLELVERALAEAAAGGSGSCGRQATLTALAAGRVERLLLDPGAPLPGAVGPGELLVATEGTAAVDLTDWVVAHALATGAAVTPVLGKAADALRGCGGVAALLRW